MFTKEKINMRIAYLFILTAVVFFVSAMPLQADIHGYLDTEGYWHFNNSGSVQDNYGQIIKQVSERFKVDRSLITAVIKAESDFDHRAVSRKGAKGLMQIMPATATLMNLEEPFNPEENITAGTRYLRLMLERFNKNKTLALAAYNAGPETVDAYRGVPPFPETKKFVRRVLNYYNQYKRLGSQKIRR
jgi:soluble lytic murein transglycosylase-like protein